MKKLNRDTLVIAAFIIVPLIMGIISFSNSKSTGIPLSFGGFRKSVAIVNLTGVIYSSSKIVKEIEDYQSNKNIVGLLVRIDSPGGAVAPSQEIFEALMRFRESEKPIAISMGTVAASRA
jgi:protease-4